MLLRPARRPRRAQRLVVGLLALLLALAEPQAAAMDVPAQLFLLGARSAPQPPRTLSQGVEWRLNGTALADLSAALQRALLWDAGWLRLGLTGDAASSSSSSSSSGDYVQVLVPCGRGMDDVLPGWDQLETRCSLESDCARPGAANASAWGCATADMAAVAQCAVREADVGLGSLSGSSSASTLTSAVENASWPAAALASAIDAAFDPQLLRFTNTSDADARLLLLAARGSWRASRDSFCFQAPLFLAPCRLLASNSSSGSGSGSGSDSGSDGGWCEPKRLPGVAEWLSIEQAALASTEQQVGGEISAGSASSSDDKDSPLLLGMMAAVVLLVVIISVPFCVARRKQRTSRQPPTTTASHRHRRHRPRSHPSSGPSADQSLSASDFRLLTDR